MKSIQIVYSTFAAVATFFFVMAFWLVFGADRFPNGTGVLAALVCAAMVARFCWRRSDSVPGGLIGNILAGALVIGGIGFVGGFVGPIIFTPESNQGPLLGIFNTGPLGFLLGAIGGAIRWRLNRS